MKKNKSLFTISFRNDHVRAFLVHGTRRLILELKILRTFSHVSVGNYKNVQKTLIYSEFFPVTVTKWIQYTNISFLAKQPLPFYYRFLSGKLVQNYSSRDGFTPIGTVHDNFLCYCCPRTLDSRLCSGLQSACIDAIQSQKVQIYGS